MTSRSSLEFDGDVEVLPKEDEERIVAQMRPAIGMILGVLQRELAGKTGAWRRFSFDFSVLPDGGVNVQRIYVVPVEEVH